MGLDVEGQRKKLQDAPWARTDMISVRDSAGRNQPTFMLHLSKVPMWLATITASKVDPAIRPKLERLSTPTFQAVTFSYQSVTYARAREKLRGGGLGQGEVEGGKAEVVG